MEHRALVVKFGKTLIKQSKLNVYSFIIDYNPFWDLSSSLGLLER